MVRFAIALAMLWAIATPVRADVFAIVPPFFEGTDGLEVSERIAKVIYDDLERQNERVLMPAETAKLVPPEQRIACGSEQCAERYRAAAQATAAIVIRIYRGKAGAGPATSFQIEIQPEPGIEFKESGLLGEGATLEQAALKALREAQRRYRRGPGPWLQITGAPTGAAIFIDDVQVGTLLGDTPRVVMVSAGNHRLRVEANGFDGMTKLVSLPTPTDTQQVDIRLEPARLSHEDELGEPLEPLPPPKRAWGNVAWVVGGAGALGVGLAFLATGIGSKVREGNCAAHDPDSGACTKQYAFDGSAKARLGVGAALTATGIFGVTWGSLKLRIAVQPTAKSAELVLRGSM